MSLEFQNGWYNNQDRVERNKNVQIILVHRWPRNVTAFCSLSKFIWSRCYVFFAKDIFGVLLCVFDGRLGAISHTSCMWLVSSSSLKIGARYKKCVQWIINLDILYRNKFCARFENANWSEKSPIFSILYIWLIYDTQKCIRSYW